MSSINPNSDPNVSFNQPVSGEEASEVSQTEEFQNTLQKDTLKQAKQNQIYKASSGKPEFPPPQSSSQESTQNIEEAKIDSALLFAQLGTVAALAEQMEAKIEKQMAESGSKKQAETMAVMDREELIEYVKNDLKLIHDIKHKEEASEKLMFAALIMLIFSPMMAAYLAIAGASLSIRANNLEEEEEESERINPSLPLPPPSMQAIEEESPPMMPIIEGDKPTILSIIENPSTLPIEDEEVIEIQAEEMWQDSDFIKKLLLSQLLTSSGDEILNSPAFETFKQEKDYAALLDQIPIAFALLSEEEQIRTTGQSPDLFKYQ